jgi:DNA-binding response OmpR family regulator
LLRHEISVLAEPAPPRRSILCVQQNPEIQAFLREALADFRVIMATTADEAVRRINNETFDAYVLDYWLADWSGASLCREIRRADPHGPICFYATAASGENRARALRAGASAFIAAPADAATLSKSMRALIKEADLASLHARVEEARVIHEELERQAAAASARADNAMKRAAKAIEHSAKIKACKAFIDAGGARAHFERWWPQQFDAGWAVHGVAPGDAGDEALRRSRADR